MHEKSCTKSRARLRINRDFVQNRGTNNRARKFVHEFFVISNPGSDPSHLFEEKSDPKWNDTEIVFLD